jgi:arabinofuranosyltransferase
MDSTLSHEAVPGVRSLRKVSWALIGAFLVLGVVHIFFGQAGQGVSSIHRIGNDDAYISYRYAQNLVAGHGLVFNPGERVEGYSNLLWVLAAASLLLVVDPGILHYSVALLGLACLTAAFIAFYLSVRRRHGDLQGFGAALLFGCAPTIWAAPASGLETAAVLALQVLLWLAVEKVADRPVRGRSLATLAVALNLLTLLRADGFVFAVLAVGYFVLRRAWRSAAVTASLAAPAIAGLFVWRCLYYGAWLPNTYYVKVDGPVSQRLGHGFTQLVALVLDQGLWPYLLALLLILLPGLRRSDPRSLPFSSAFALGVVAYWLYVGGDHFGERFLLLLIPLGIVAWLEIASRFKGSVLLAGTAIILVLQLRPLLDDQRFRYSRSRYDGWITAGEFLAERHPGAFLATGAAGKIPYFSRLRTLDMLGLTDAHIARTQQAAFLNPGHDKSDPDYVLSRRPDLIVTWIAPSRDMDLGLRRSVYLAANYRLRYVVNASPTAVAGNVVEVAEHSAAEIDRLISKSHRLGILELIPPASSEGSY